MPSKAYVQTDQPVAGLSIGTYPVTAFFNINNLFNVTGGYYRPVPPTPA
jgi:hypothetical protein